MFQRKNIITLNNDFYINSKNNWNITWRWRIWIVPSTNKDALKEELKEDALKMELWIQIWSEGRTLWYEV